MELTLQRITDKKSLRMDQKRFKSMNAQAKNQRGSAATSEKQGANRKKLGGGEVTAGNKTLAWRDAVHKK